MASRRTSTYSKAQTDEWTGRIAIVLAENNEYLTIPEIQERDIALAGITTAKMSKMLSHLIEFNLATKLKNSNGRMMYKGVSS